MRNVTFILLQNYDIFEPIFLKINGTLPGENAYICTAFTNTRNDNEETDTIFKFGLCSTYICADNYNLSRVWNWTISKHFGDSKELFFYRYDGSSESHCHLWCK